MQKVAYLFPNGAWLGLGFRWVRATQTESAFTLALALSHTPWEQLLRIAAADLEGFAHSAAAVSCSDCGPSVAHKDFVSGSRCSRFCFIGKTGTPRAKRGVT